MASFYTEAELASDTYRMLTDARTLREFIVVAASVFGNLCDDVIPLEEISELKHVPVHDYESFCDWVGEQPVRPNAKEHWRYHWNLASCIFYAYEQHPTMDDWELYLEVIDPHNPDWDETVDDKEQCFRDRTTETCFTIRRWVKASSSKCMKA